MHHGEAERDTDADATTAHAADHAAIEATDQRTEMLVGADDGLAAAHGNADVDLAVDASGRPRQRATEAIHVAFEAERVANELGHRVEVRIGDLARHDDFDRDLPWPAAPRQARAVLVRRG